MTVLLAALAGLAAGGAHVLAGPDHLAAVAPLAASTPGRGSWRLGARWGVGHALGVVAIGAPLVLVRERVAIEWLSRYGERLVGVTLVGIALWSLRRALAARLHAHEHEHDGVRHAHVHLHLRRPHHAPPDATRHGTPPGAHRHPPHAHRHAALGIGVLHGVAGSSHLFGVLPAVALPTAAASASYLGAFATGTLLAMIAFAALAGRVGGRLAAAGRYAHAGLLGALAVAAAGVGAWWIVR